MEKRISYVQLTTNLDLLTRIFPYVSESAADRDIGIAVAKQMDFSKESAIVDFIKNWEEIIRRYGSRRIDGAVMGVLIGRMLETATVDGLVNAAKYMHNGSSRELYELEEMLPRTFVRVSRSCIVNSAHVDSVDRSFTGPSRIGFRSTYKKAYASRKHCKSLMDILKETR